MQVKKEDIKERIISSARREFLAHGYEKASLRTIAENEGLTKGAVYSYFENKDTLFCEITAPATNFIESQFQQDKCCCMAQTRAALLPSYETTIQSFRNCAHAVLLNRESFRLLLFCSAGSSLQNYKERIIQLYAQNFCKFLPCFTKKKPGHEGVMSEMFIHTLANTYVSFLEEIVLHVPDSKEADDYAGQMAVFAQSGINALFSHLQ